jgi:ClpP class serine protease
MAIYDYSEWLKKWGVSVDLFKVGKYKAAGLVGTSLTEEQKENFQQSVERSAKQFKGFVTSQRDVSAEAMEGQTFPGDEAVAENLVDSITTLEGAVRDALALASMLNTQGKED